MVYRLKVKEAKLHLKKHWNASWRPKEKTAPRDATAGTASMSITPKSSSTTTGGRGAKVVETWSRFNWKTTGNPRGSRLKNWNWKSTRFSYNSFPPSPASINRWRVTTRSTGSLSNKEPRNLSEGRAKDLPTWGTTKAEDPSQRRSGSDLPQYLPTSSLSLWLQCRWRFTTASSGIQVRSIIYEFEFDSEWNEMKTNLWLINKILCVIHIIR